MVLRKVVFQKKEKDFEASIFFFFFIRSLSIVEMAILPVLQKEEETGSTQRSKKTLKLAFKKNDGDDFKQGRDHHALCLLLLKRK